MTRKGKSGWAYGTQYAVPPDTSLGSPKKRFSETFSAASALKELRPSRELTERDLEEIIKRGLVDSQHPIIQQLARMRMRSTPERDIADYVYERLKAGPFCDVSPLSDPEISSKDATDQIDILVVMISDLRKAIADLTDGMEAHEITAMNGMPLERAQHIKDFGY